MKRTLILALILFTGVASNVFGQAASQTTESVEELKLRLIDIQARQEIARLQLEQLDESLKPENIERALAGIGSTKPEELREQRRRQLTMEKTSVSAELELLELKRTRLEEAIAEAEARAYQKSAKAEPAIDNAFRTNLNGFSFLLAIAVVAVVSVASGLGGVFALRRS
jgi:hypothetical protein